MKVWLTRQTCLTTLCRHNLLSMHLPQLILCYLCIWLLYTLAKLFTSWHVLVKPGWVVLDNHITINFLYTHVVGDDYYGVLTLVTFHIGSTYASRQCFYISIINDDIQEMDEHFFLYTYSYNIQVYIPKGRDFANVVIQSSKYNPNLTVHNCSRSHFIS